MKAVKVYNVNNDEKEAKEDLLPHQYIWMGKIGGGLSLYSNVGWGWEGGW